MTSKEAMQKGQIQSWQQFMSDVRARQSAKEARWAQVGFKPNREIGQSNDQAAR